MLNIPTQKYVKSKYHYEERYWPLKFEICIEMIGKCTRQMAHNCLKIDNFEKICFGGIENYMYCKKYFSISMKCLAGGIICHAMSLHSLSISNISNYFKQSFECVDFSEIYILSIYRYQLVISMNIQKDFTQESPGKLF